VYPVPENTQDPVRRNLLVIPPHQKNFLFNANRKGMPKLFLHGPLINWSPQRHLTKAENPGRQYDPEWSRHFSKIPAASSSERSKLIDTWIAAKQQGDSVDQIWREIPEPFRKYLEHSIALGQLLTHT
jgi:hypothetical protein